MKAQVFLFVCLLGLAAETAVSKGKHRSFCSLTKCKDRPRWKKYDFFLNFTLSLLPQYILATVLVHELFAKYDFS